jgi:hypothetical protein
MEMILFNEIVENLYVQSWPCSDSTLNIKENYDVCIKAVRIIGM